MRVISLLRRFYINTKAQAWHMRPLLIGLLHKFAGDRILVSLDPVVSIHKLGTCLLYVASGS